MSKFLKIVLVFVLFGMLILVKAFENQLFYDPLLKYFKGDHLNKALPNLNIFRLAVSYGLRFLLNTIISITILKIAFSKQVVLKPLFLFYGLTFLVLSTLFFSLVIFKVDVGYLVLFYIRRFLIQPIFVLVLFPLFFLYDKGYRMI